MTYNVFSETLNPTQSINQSIFRISCRHVSVCPSVTSRCSTDTAKRRITQTTPHDSRGKLILVSVAEDFGKT